MSVTNRPQIEAYIGASGSGKGVSINRRLAELAPVRLLIWDPRDEYAKQAPAVRSLPDLVAAFRKAGAGPIRVRYVPGSALKLADAFGLVCALAFEAGALCFLAEELSDVTTPGFAPAPWRRITTQGRHRGLQVLGAAQRPSLIDKTFLGNCTRVRCFQLGYEADRRAMARELDCPDDALGLLLTDDTATGVVIRYLQRDRRERTLIAGEIHIRNGKFTEKTAPFGGR